MKWVIAALALGAPAAAQTNCHLALALALDVSSSVDQAEYDFQRDGLADALMSREVRTALFAGHDSVALAVYEWSGRAQQALVLDWTLIYGTAALESAVDTIRNTQRSLAVHPTAIGQALTYGANLFSTAPECSRQTIDISGDGYNNDGPTPLQVYQTGLFKGITVNGLVISTSFRNVPGYFRREVIHGPESFVEIAWDYPDFSNAMRRKLVREIGVSLIGQVQIPIPGEAPS